MTPAPLSLSLSCAGSATLSTAYIVIWITRKNIPVGDLPPDLSVTISGLSTEDGNIANWGTSSAEPTPTHGTWNASTTYALGDTVASSAYAMRSTDGTLNIPIVYRSRIGSNKNNWPENFDGNWTCITQPDSAVNENFPVVPFGYALSPLPSKSDLASASWVAGLGQSLSWNAPSPPGDVLQLVDIFVRLNYLVGSSIVFTQSFPLTNSVVTGTQGLITNPGINAQFQCWHTSGLSSTPQLTLSGFDLTAYIDGSQPGATVGSSYLSALSATGGTPPYSYGIIAGSLPPGVTLNGTTGVISGTPSGSGVFDFTAQVTDNTGATATASCGVPVSCGAAPSGAAGNAFY